MIWFSPCVRYMSELFYIGPIYHLAFTKLDKMIMLDSTDLGVLSDLEVHISLSSQEHCWHCNSGPVVRVLWTWKFWRLPLGRWSWPRPALLQSGNIPLEDEIPIPPSLQLDEYRRKWPSSKVGQPGRLGIHRVMDDIGLLKVLPTFFSDWSSHSKFRLQGLNTGVVLYHLERMRESLLYNSYLHPEAVDHLMER